MKWIFLLAFLVQRNCISSQPLTNENVRESRQLKSDECCPCPTADRTKDNHVLDTNIVPSDCPCRAADSETASSIFTPRAVQSFVRPQKDEPKPLLNPEVGLASSVLETLREVTDQEYEEALARDAARSALQEVHSDADEMPVSASTNVFNNILSPRNSEAMDVTPEASNNEETRCIYPTLNRISEFGHFEIQPRRNSLKDFLLFKPSVLKNIFDMDNSPSNIQENILPTKNKLLDNIKIKTNLLKSKLLTNNKGLLQRMVTDKSFDNTDYNKSHKIPGWKLVAPSDNLKSSKLFDPNGSPPVAEKIRDFSLLGNNDFKNNAQNNKKVVTPLRKHQQSNKYVTDEVLSSEAYNFPMSKEVQRYKNTKDYDIDSNVDTSILSPVLSPRDNCNLKKENMLQTETTTEKNDFSNGIDANTSNLPVLIPTHYSTEILDTLPSPSENTEDENQLIDLKNNPPQENNNPPEIIIENKPELNTQSTFGSKPTSIAKPTAVQDNTNNLSIEKNSEEANKYIPELVCTTENSKTSDPIAINTDVFNVPVNQKGEGNIYSINAESNQEDETFESSNNLLNKNKENKVNIFPNISEGLKKTFENVKKINEKWQEKIKLDVQNALELVNVKNNVVMQEEPKQNPVYIPEILTKPHKSNAKTPNTRLNTLSSQELQKMSDSILSLSSVNQHSDPNSSIAIKEASDTIETMDNGGEPSEIISCLTPAEVFNSRKAEENPLHNNNKQIIKSGFENQQHFRNLNTDMDMEDKPTKIETPMEKSSFNIIDPSTARFDENEMAAQASESNPQRNTKNDLDSSKYLRQDFVVQPNNELNEFERSLSNVNHFFDSVKSSISNVLSKTNENIFRETEDKEYKIGNNYKLSKQDNSWDLQKPKLNLKKSATFLKAPETDTLTLDKYKPNMNLYKARVAVPKTFEVKPILTLDETLDKQSQTLTKPRNILPKKYSTNEFVNSNENVGNQNLRSLFKESAHNNLNSEATILSPNIFHNSFRSASKNPGSLKDRTEEALQNYHNKLGSPLRTVPSKENNGYLNKNLGNENLFETMVSKRNEWNEKLQAINLDLNDRLSLLSHRMADSILPSLNSQPKPQRRISAKSRSDVKNKPGSDYLRRINTPSDIKSTLPRSKLRQSNDNLSLPKALKKSLISDHLSNLKSARLYENPISTKRTLVKPAIINSESIISGLKPQTMKKVSNLIPKITAPSVEKNPFVSRLKSREPYSLGSENIMSRVLLDKNTDTTDKSVMDVSSNESDQKIDSNIKNIKASKKEEARNLALSKLREAFKAKLLNRDSNKKKSKDDNFKSSANTDDEIIPSASENVNKEIDGSLKQNIQYKCKMLCTKDK